MLTDNNRIIGGPEELPKPDWVVYPEWLDINDPKFAELYADIGALREFYIVFAALENSRCQMAMAGGLINYLRHLSDNVYNQWDYSLAGLNYAKSQIERANLDWLEKLDGITDLMGATDFDIRAEIEEGKPIKITGGAALQAMYAGSLGEDFLYKHPATRSAFIRYSTVVLLSQMGQRMENLGKDLQATQVET